MGYAAAGACYSTTAEAYAAWCAHVEPGSSGSSCASCDGAGSCSVNLISSGTAQTVSVPVSLPSCEVPTPVADATAWTGAVVGLWIAVAAAAAVIRMFRVPHVDLH